MTTNIEKLAEELNALTDYDPMALECLDATVSLTERRIYLRSFMPDNAVFHIDFDQILPYDLSGAPGTTSDVCEGAGISLHVTPDGYLFKDQKDADEFGKGYLRSIRISLFEAACEGRISSKTLAETKFEPGELDRHISSNKEIRKEAKERRDAWHNSLEPEAREAAIKFGKELRAKRRAEGQKAEELDDL